MYVFYVKYVSFMWNLCALDIVKICVLGGMYFPKQISSVGVLAVLYCVTGTDLDSVAWYFPVNNGQRWADLQKHIVKFTFSEEICIWRESGTTFFGQMAPDRPWSSLGRRRPVTEPNSWLFCYGNVRIWENQIWNGSPWLRSGWNFGKMTPRGSGSF